MNKHFSFVVLTYNEEMHLPRLLQSIAGLNARVFILDSGSTDDTVAIGESFGATFLQHPFENHPKQWDFALRNFDIQTPWVIGLDADHIVTPELLERLTNFRDEDYQGINGIYFNRKNFFKGRWLRYGGYYPFYQLKLIRYGIGYSDLNENMDHRFVVPGQTMVWKDGHILEENLKENQISFWIAKHNRYSDQVAHEEVERLQQIRSQTVKPHFWGSPDERRARLKQVWWQLPRYTRPMLYFIYRMFFKLGILDGRTGVIFHFLQGFWFRLVVDIKIDELLQQQKNQQQADHRQKNEALKFVVSFALLFAAFYYFNIYFFSLTTHGRHYNAIAANYINYIGGLRWLLLHGSAQILNWFGFTAVANNYQLLVVGHNIIQLVYSCLGLGVVSFFAAFVLSYPKKTKAKMRFLLWGILGIEILNLIRVMLLALFWNRSSQRIIDHHTIFNIIVYILIAITLYLWVKRDKRPAEIYAAN